MTGFARRWPYDDKGQIAVFGVVITAATVMFAGLVLDGGLALAAKSRALGEAQEAARAGAQAIDVAAYRRDGTWALAPGEARKRARTYLSSTADEGSVAATTTSVSVTITARQSTELLRLFGVDELTVTAVGSARPVRGVTVRGP
ncbi:pilus assembly protein TadG-related protein [Streptomyces sp. NPDC001401]|uniref:pilus assembly protein TadG-related protein n=1 Tax=Streptomyces sp. NPDC001401 TaxID=3364570 RepID=UPI00369996DE